MSSTKLLEYTTEDKVAILKQFERTLGTVKQDIEAIRQWLKKQPHLPEVTDVERIERFLLMNKFSIERTKEKIDMYYTIRQLMPEFYNELPDTERMRKVCEVMYLLPLPKLTKDLCRVVVFKLRQTNPDDFDLGASLIYQELIREILLKEDYSASNIFLVDFENSTWAHHMKITPTIIKKQVTIMQKVFSSRLKTLCFINVSPVMDTFVSLLKAVIPRKFAERIHTSRDSGCLTKFISKEILPVDLGGGEVSLDELNDKWKAKLLEYKPRYDKLQKLKVDESRRPGKTANCDVHEVRGNFRKLEID